jgi:hypothetical protein
MLKGEMLFALMLPFGVRLKEGSYPNQKAARTARNQCRGQSFTDITTKVMTIL